MKFILKCFDRNIEAKVEPVKSIELNFAYLLNIGGGICLKSSDDSVQISVSNTFAPLPYLKKINNET